MLLSLDSPELFHPRTFLIANFFLFSTFSAGYTGMVASAGKLGVGRITLTFGTEVAEAGMEAVGVGLCSLNPFGYFP